MKRLTLALAIVLVAALQCFALPRHRPQPSQAPQLVTSASGVIYPQEQIHELPQDGGKPFLTLFGNPQSATTRQLDSWFRTHAELSKITNQTHYKFIPTNSPMNEGRYEVPHGKTVVRLQLPGGHVVASMTDSEIPLSPEALTRALNGKAAECFRRRRECPAPMPSPQPPVIDDDPEPQPLDDSIAPPRKPELPYALFGVVGFIALIAGAGFEAYRKYRTR